MCTNCSKEGPSEHQETLFFYSVRVTENQNKLPRDVVESLYLEIPPNLSHSVIP